jgi:N-acetylmuramoyl-L-alanine amidase
MKPAFSMQRLSAALLAIATAACTPAPVRTELSSTWRPSPNFDLRRPDYVVIHHTSDPTAADALNILTDPVRAVSAHYLIARDGTLYQLVDERARAWHAGKSQWGNDTDLNSVSLGIELDNNGEEPFAEAQIATLLALLGDIEQRYHIPAANFIGHADVAPTRKNDPSRFFPWRRLAAQGYGLWCASPPPALPPGFDVKLALQLVGYDVSDLDAAIRAFKLHFVQDDTPPPLSEADQRVLACVAGLKNSAARD